ncbi:MAG: substrate-binding domain-containing protein [Treponema sp.]|jgi:D-xylose transport system substrate-binding protein|nr:substrate-binding domain-containing protein [Treponema sp.]
MENNQRISTGKAWKITVLTLVCMALFGSCGGQRQQTGPGRSASPSASQVRDTAAAVETAGGPAGITIGFSISTDDFVTERWNKDMRAFSGAAQELGANVIVQLSAGGIQKQISQINYMVNQKIDILVIVAHDTDMIAGAIKQVRDAGIPVIAYDRLIMGVPIDAYISFDNREVGRMFGRALLDAVPQGKYLMVNGSVVDSNSYEVSAGLHEILDPVIASGDIQLNREIWLDEWSFDEALEKVGAIFAETTDFDAISCGNDQIAGAVIQLLAERRLAGKVAVVGQDAELISCQHVVEGLQLMTVYKPIGKLGPRAAKLAMSIAENNRLPGDSLADNQSGTMIPTYTEMPIAVYKDNMDVVLKDGFHSYEDIYRNVTADISGEASRGMAY